MVTDFPHGGSKAGTVLADRFLLQSYVGGGYTAEVYEGRDQRTGEHVVVKVFRRGLVDKMPEYTAHLDETYATLAGAGEAQFLLLPLAVGESDGVRWEAFRYLVDVESLDSLIHDKAPLDPGFAIPLLVQLTEALAYLHGRDVVHADLKPSNVLLLPGDPPHVLLTNRLRHGKGRYARRFPAPGRHLSLYAPKPP